MTNLDRRLQFRNNGVHSATLRVEGILQGLLWTIAILLLQPLSGLTGTMKHVPLTIHALTKRAEIIVIGTVMGVTSGWSDDKAVIFTRIAVDVEESFKGSAKIGGRITFMQLGGRAGDMSSFVAGTPRFEEKERALIFLSRRENGSLSILDVYQGKFSLEMDPRTGTATAVRRLPESETVIDRIPLNNARGQILTALRG